MPQCEPPIHIALASQNNLLSIHPRKLTWNLKMIVVLKRNLPSIFKFHVSFPGEYFLKKKILYEKNDFPSPPPPPVHLGLGAASLL